jgi:hypothetical protein
MNINDLIKLLQAVQKCPMMYMMGSSYEEHVAFIQGIHFMTDPPIFEGFSDSLVLKINRGHNLGWPLLVLYVAFPDSHNPRKEMERQPQFAIETLYRLVNEHLDKRRTIT